MFSTRQFLPVHDQSGADDSGVQIGERGEGRGEERTAHDTVRSRKERQYP